MDGIRFSSWIKGLILSTLLLSLTSTAASRQAISQVIIVKGSDNTYFDQTVTTLLKHVDQAERFKIVLANELDSQSPYQGRDKLFVSLGQAAVEAVNKLGRKSLSINAYLTLEQYNSLDLDDQLTVLLDQPLQRYLAFCKLMLDVDSIGVIADSTPKLGQQQAKTLKEFELVLNQYQVNPLNKLLPVLRNLLKQNDVLLMLPRQSIYNRDTLKGVLLTSYRSRKPVISYSPAHVKSGALASIYSSPEDIGRHLALLVNRSLKNQPIHDTPFQFARFYSIATNPRVARALGIHTSSEQAIRARLDRLSQ